MTPDAARRRGFGRGAGNITGGQRQERRSSASLFRESVARDSRRACFSRRFSSTERPGFFGELVRAKSLASSQRWVVQSNHHGEKAANQWRKWPNRFRVTGRFAHSAARSAHGGCEGFCKLVLRHRRSALDADVLRFRQQIILR